MIKVENVKVFNFEGAIRGMRNPLDSWDKSDSHFDYPSCDSCPHDGKKKCSLFDCVVIGKNDLDLMQRLYKCGTEHRKYLRQIFVTMDIVAPLYWWKEFDTYKIGTVANSCSTMHTIHKKPFTIDDFSHEHLSCIDIGAGIGSPYQQLKDIIRMLNVCRELYLQTKDKEYWWQMIQLLPSSYNQRRTVTMNYENVMNMINQREHHKLDEWVELVKILKELPYVKEIRDEA